MVIFLNNSVSINKFLETPGLNYCEAVCKENICEGDVTKNHTVVK